MKTFTTYKIICTILLLLLGVQTNIAQIGIATDQPKGVLDVQNSNLAGIVFPKAALTAANVAAPVLNPQGGNLAVGTIIFNTSSTSTGSFDVYPGIYAWDGGFWKPQYLLEDAVTFTQSSLNFRVATSDSYVDVPGLESGSTFTAKYTGTYRVKANFNFGAGEILTPSSGDIRMATQEGFFRFSFDGTNHEIYTHAYSIYNDHLTAPDNYMEQFRHDSSLILYENLVAGQTYDFGLEIDTFVSDNFVDNGNSGTGRAHVGISIPCVVEFTYLEEN